MFVPVRQRKRSSKNIPNSTFYYPDVSEPNFYETLTTKKEYASTKVIQKETTMEQECIPSSGVFELLPQQEFIRNFIHPDTPYNGVLLFHGTGVGKTCAGVQISLGFLPYLHQFHRDSEKSKVLILTPNEKIRDTWMKEIADVDFMFKERMKERDVELRQCTGDMYMIDPKSARHLDYPRYRLELLKRIRRDFTFMGHQEFKNKVLREIGEWDGEVDHLTDAQRATLADIYRNRLILVDEAHHIRGQANLAEARKLAPVFEAVVRFGQNLKLILLTATPMFDDPSEIIYLMNLLLWNDRRPSLDKTDFFDSNGILIPGAAETLMERMRGYISYVRGENPIRFPLRLTPTIATIPKVQYDWKGEKIDDFDNLKHLQICPVSMSKEHYALYNTLFKEYIEILADSSSNNNNANHNDQASIHSNNAMSEETEGNENDEDRLDAKPFIYLSNCWFPTKSGGSAIPKVKGGAYNNKIDANATFLVQNRKITRFGEKSAEIVQTFQYQPHAILNKGKRDEVPFLDRSVLSTYSAKWANIFDELVKSRGISLVYSTYVWAGVIPFALMLEQNGITRYIPPKSGDVPLLEYLPNGAGGGGKRLGICAVCGKNYGDGKHVTIEKLASMKVGDGYPGDRMHIFREMKYVLIMGDTSKSAQMMIRELQKPENRWGETIKIILGTKSIAEGVDFKNIRQVHLLEPRYNRSGLEQIVGRAVRTCSHMMLPSEERNVDVYLWVHMASEDASKEERETELVDFRYYRRTQVKDRKIRAVEHIMKRAAVDCTLFKALNQYTTRDMKTIMGSASKKIMNSTGKKMTVKLGDQPGSRECDYLDTCELQCAWEPTKGKILPITTYTYTVDRAKTIVKRAKRYIRDAFRISYVYSLDGLIQYLREKMPDTEAVLFYRAIQDYLERDRTGQPVYYLFDAYHRKGYLLARGGYYVWQPLELDDTSIPLMVRSRPFLEYPKHIPYMEAEESAEFADNVSSNTLSEEGSIAGETHWETLVVEYDKLNDLIVGLKPIVGVSMLLDRLPTSNMHIQLIRYLCEQMSTALKKKVLSDLWDEDLWEAVMWYYRPIWIGGEVTKKSKSLPNAFIWNSNVYKIRSNGDFEVVLGEEKAKLQEEWSQTGYQIIVNLPKTSNDIHGFMKETKGLWQFMILDRTKETGRKTLEEKRSRRSESRGRACNNFDMPYLRRLIEKLAIDDIDNKSRYNFCMKLEHHLRSKDPLFQTGKRLSSKRFFISTMETYML